MPIYLVDNEEVPQEDFHYFLKYEIERNGEIEYDFNDWIDDNHDSFMVLGMSISPSIAFEKVLPERYKLELGRYIAQMAEFYEIELEQGNGPLRIGRRNFNITQGDPAEVEQELEPAEIDWFSEEEK